MTFQIYRRLLRYVRPYRGRLVLATSCMLVLAAATSLQAMLIGPALKFIMTGGAGGADPFARLLRFAPGLDPARLSPGMVLAALPLVILAVAVVKGLAHFGQFYLMATTGQKVVADLRLSLFRHLTGLSPAHFAGRHSGEVMSHFGSDLGGVEAAVTYAVSSAVRDSVMVLSLLWVAFSLDWRLALIAFGVVPAAMIPLSRLVRRLKRSTRQMQEAAARISERISETMGSLRVVQAFGAEEHEARRFKKEILAMLAANRRSIIARGLGSPIGEVLGMGVGLAATLWYGARAVGDGSLRSEDLVSFLATVAFLYTPVKTLGTVGPSVITAATGAERVFKVLDEVSQVRDAPGAAPIAPFREAARFEEVGFRYGERQVLHEVSFAVARGEVVALVGKSGAGKTTLANLLARFYDPTEGRIAIDGIDLRAATLASLRAQIALVTQETLLFRDTVRANIAYGRPAATEAEIESAARRACAEEFIAQLPQGYQTLLGERGHNLSGGQRQRIAIARALLKDAPILILDEATSSLDSESERAVQSALGHLMEGRTVLVIAHRLSTVQRADRIVVLREGRIVEQGKHAELLALGGEYRRLYDLQFEDAPRAA